MQTAKLKLILIALALLLPFAAIAVPASPVHAAAFEFSAAGKAAFDKMADAAKDGTQLKKQYSDLQSAQKRELDWDRKINELHYRNEEALAAARSRIKQIGAKKQADLAAEVEKTRSKYEPLFELYDSLKQQLALAKSLNSKTMTAILQPQVDTAKTAIAMAREDIKAKENALKKAKDEANAAKKKLNGMLAPINDSLKIKIRSSKGTISSLKKSFATEGKILNQSVRRGDAAASSASFIRMLDWQQQINEQKQSIYKYETQIGSIISNASAQIP
ncbi:hypothetical protein [Paenibacillus sp. NEAU-GSW1]|uniref:hypothetical protein n=1 Tax=Paenibacillus sp. NEAU-GSW1 TaxID=2682486 RepID=UPI0012E2F299|nr:hypothetical protein [Paenibacillus sp. NEAU-GSW1]MUT64782.1 hypothetical protein [Paenibacillus sp. NEAU-GSW1]